MKKSTKNILKIIISIIYIAWGILSPLSAIQAIIALDISAILSATVGVLTLLAGIFGLIGIKKTMIFALLSRSAPKDCIRSYTTVPTASRNFKWDQREPSCSAAPAASAGHRMKTAV